MMALVAAIAVISCPSILAFAPASISRQSHFQSLSSSSSSSLSATASSATKEFPPLSEVQIRKLLDAIPVYAVVDPSKEAIVLLAEKENPNSLAYLSFSPNHINEVYAPIRAQQDESTTWEITAFPLGLVWFELLQNPDAVTNTQWVVNDIEYRLLPDPQQLKEARNLVQQTYKSGPKSQYFQKAYNEIPLFIDDYLRVQDADGNPLVPMYFGLNDLLETCQDAVNASEGKYKASVNLSDLWTVISQMQQSSPTNFGQAIFVPPTSGSITKESGDNYEIPSIPTEMESSQSTEFEIPVINQWDD
ncbi:Tic22-like family protein [Nitzschia inconspicua]|uniref:Tic22-like family protein n=1 Tax=Nitzschia inconspicua TaxID=303405 RepID=A0A9K3L274_9STRA|nr:Tic22-like family protein [Nitzschia inconspicua]